MLLLLAAPLLAPAALPPCEWWTRSHKRARITGQSFFKCVREALHDPKCFTPGTKSCDGRLEKAQWYSCWNAGWPLSSEEARTFHFSTLESLAAHNASLRTESAPYYVAIGGTDAEAKLERKPGLCFDLDGPMCALEPSLTPILGRVTPSSLVASLRSHETPVDFDVLKLDVDSIECPLLDAVMSAGYRPRVIISEASPAWPPPLLFRREAAEYTPPRCPAKAQKKMWLHVGGEFFYGCSLQETYEVLKPHGYVLVQYAMEDATFVHRDSLHRVLHPVRRGGAPADGMEPVEAYARGNPHIYFRNNGANATLSRKLLDVMRDHARGRGHGSALLETTLRLFEEHSGLDLRDVPHRAGFFHRAKGARVWSEGPQHRWVGSSTSQVVTP